MIVSLSHVSKQLGRTAALQDISLEIADRELFFLLGPSGCGKTTLLRLLAGFHPADTGELRFGGRLMNGVPPHARQTGMVFQNYALWPHLTVAKNVAYGLEARRVTGDEVKRRTREALEVVHMQDHADRSPNQLSGGQQQRVALARALVVKPDVLLLDEPLSNLDARLRLEMREEIRRIHRETRITTVYVTHDQEESLSLADRLAVMREGRFEQVGTPREIYRSPANRFVADFMGETNWLPAEVSGQATDGISLATPVGPIQMDRGSGKIASGHLWLGFRPASVRIGESSINALSAVIEEVTYLGPVDQYRLVLRGNQRVKAVETSPAQPRQPGDKIMVHLRPDEMFVLPRDAA